MRCRVIQLPDPARPFEVRFMERPAFVFAGALSLALVTLFVLRLTAPLEMALQDAFFQPSLCPGAQEVATGERRCGFFPFRESPFWQILRDVGFKGPLLLAGIGGLAYLWPRAKAPIMTPARLAPAVLGASALWLGSLGLINMVIKPVFGRPRPDDLTLFGGTDTYVFPGSISDQCAVNCSFMSGEASTALALAFFALLLPASLRIAGTVLALMVALFISGLRVAFGGHFLSDVVMAWWLVILVALATAWWLQTPMGGAFLERCCGLLNRFRGVARAQV